MSDSTMDTVGDKRHRRARAARLELATNSVLFEALKPFHRSPELLKRMGRSGLFLFSHSAMNVNEGRGGINLDDDPESHPAITTVEANRLARDLRRLSTGDSHMRMAEHLQFAKTPGGGILIEMAVLLTPIVKARLSSTAFAQHDADDLLVDLYIDGNNHAGGTAMQRAARELDATLKQPYPPAGTETIDLTIK